MNELNKLIAQYERENPCKSAKENIYHKESLKLAGYRFTNKFVEFLARQIEKLATRPTCTNEEREILDEIQKGHTLAVRICFKNAENN